VYEYTQEELEIIRQSLRNEVAIALAIRQSKGDYQHPRIIEHNRLKKE